MKLATLSALAFLAVGALLAPTASAQGDKPAAPKADQPIKAPTPPPATPAKPGAQPPKTQPPATAAPDPAKAGDARTYVIMKTNLGNITMELNNERAPISSQNFLAYVDKKFYDGLVFHRVVNSGTMKVIQAGAFPADMSSQKKGDKSIKNEWTNGLKNTRGTIAMARLAGQADSASSQFFINVKDHDYLDRPSDGSGYAVFGRVVDGMDVVDKIDAVKTGVKNGMPDVPVDPVVMQEVRRATADEAAQIKSKIDKK